MSDKEGIVSIDVITGEQARIRESMFLPDCLDRAVAVVSQCEAQFNGPAGSVIVKTRRHGGSTLFLLHETPSCAPIGMALLHRTPLMQAMAVREFKRNCSARAHSIALRLDNTDVYPRLFTAVEFQFLAGAMDSERVFLITATLWVLSLAELRHDSGRTADQQGGDCP